MRVAHACLGHSFPMAELALVFLSGSSGTQRIVQNASELPALRR